MKATNKQLIAIVAGIVVGALLGGLWPQGGLGVKFLGDLFIRALLMLVVPLIVASMIVGVTSLGDVRKFGRLGGTTIVYYMVTTAVSVVIGLLLVVAVSPGKADTEAERVALRGGQILTDTGYTITGDRIVLDGEAFKGGYDKDYKVILVGQSGISGKVKPAKGLVENALHVVKWVDVKGEPVVPDGAGTGVLVDLAVAGKVEGKSGSIGEALQKVVVGLIPKNLVGAMVGNDVLPLIVFSLVFGIILTTLGEKGRPVIALFEGVNAAVMKMIQLLMLAAPVGIGALIAGELGKAGGFEEFGVKLVKLGKYAGVVIAGLAIHGGVVLPLILRTFGRRRIGDYVRNMAPALTTAFSTASSSATIPVTMECCVDLNSVREETASFVLPLGATVNMDGTALYEAVAAVFIAQIYGIELGFGHLIVIFLTATLAAVGAAGIPQAGLVTMVIVLKAVKLPVEGITLILVIDWFLDRCRTTVNVWGDAVGAAVVDRMYSPKATEPGGGGGAEA